MAAGRLPPLEELGLPENSPFEVVLHADLRSPANPQRRLRGRLADGQIELVAGPVVGPGFALGQRVDPRGFLAAAGYSRRVINYYRYIWQPELGITLDSRVNADERNATAEQQRIAGVLGQECGGTSLRELRQHVEAHPIAGNVYRVCRLDEKDIETQGLTSNSGLQRSWQQAGAAGLAAYDFLKDVNSHIFNGSKSNHTRLPLISATRDLHTALSWGYGGCHTVVAINVQAAAAAGVRAYDMGGSLNSLCWSGMAQYFAASSAEVVFDGNIPARCVTVLRVTWDPLGDRILSSPDAARAFPARLRRSDIEVLEELEDGTSKPLKVEAVVRRPNNQEPIRREFVLKRSGGAGGTTRIAHIVSEFTAMAMYARAGLKVPAAALYTVKVAVASENVEAVVKYLLVEWLEGTRPTLDHFLADQALGRRLRAEFEQGIALDVALSNADAAGPAFSNLLLVERRGRLELYRIDKGGCGFYDYVGKRKPLYLFEQTNSSDVVKTFQAMSRQDGIHGHGAQAAPLAASALPGNNAPMRADVLLEHLMQRVRLAGVAASAKTLRQQLHTQLQNWLVAGASGMSETLVDTVVRALARLAALERCSQVTGPEPPRFDASQQLKQIALENCRAVKNRTRPSGYTATFERRYLDPGYEVWDVTSRGKHRQLSPFTAVGTYNIDVPGQPSGTKAKCVEGIWQGLKVFQGYEQDPRRDVDRSRFAITNGANLKRMGVVAGHAWHGESGTEPRQLLSYVEARRKIYVPAFTWVIENVPAVRDEVVKLARAATQRDIVLLDYFTNDQVDNEGQPLSHGGLLRKYIQSNWRRLLGLAEPAAAEQPEGTPAAQASEASTSEDEGPETSAAAAARAPRFASTRRAGAEDTPAAREAQAARPTPSTRTPSAAVLAAGAQGARRVSSDARAAAAASGAEARAALEAAAPTAPAAPAAAAAAGHAAAAARACLLSSATVANPQAAAIIVQGGPDGGWLSSEQVRDLITHREEWSLPKSAVLKQQPEIGDMLLVESSLVSNGIEDGLVWRREPNKRGNLIPVRRSSYLKVGGEKVGTCAKYYTEDGTIERRVYILTDAPGVRLLHYHQAKAAAPAAQPSAAAGEDEGPESSDAAARRLPRSPSGRRTGAEAVQATPSEAAPTTGQQQQQQQAHHMSSAKPAPAAATGKAAKGKAARTGTVVPAPAAPAPGAAGGDKRSPAPQSAAAAATASPAAAAADGATAAGVRLLASAAGIDPQAAAIVAQGGPDGGWLSSEQVHALLTHRYEWRLPKSAVLQQQPQIGDMLLVDRGLSNRIDDGLVLEREQKGDRKVIVCRTEYFKVDGVKLFTCAKYYTEDGTMERRLYTLDNDRGVRLLHYHQASAGGRKHLKRKAPEPIDDENNEEEERRSPASRAWQFVRRLFRPADPAATEQPAGLPALLPRPASNQDEGPETSAAAAGRLPRSPSGRCMGAEAGRPERFGWLTSAGQQQQQQARRVSFADHAPANAAGKAATGKGKGAPKGVPAPAPAEPASTAPAAAAPTAPAAASGGAAAAGVRLLSTGAGVGPQAAAIITQGGPDGGWLSSEQVHALLTHREEWSLPKSAVLQQQPQIGDMLLVDRSLVIRGINDGPAWETEPRGNGHSVLVRRTADITVDGVKVGSCTKNYTADGTMERRSYTLTSIPDVTLLHYHRAPEGGRKTVKRKAPEAGAAGPAGKAALPASGA